MVFPGNLRSSLRRNSLENQLKIILVIKKEIKRYDLLDSLTFSVISHFSLSLSLLIFKVAKHLLVKNSPLLDS